MLASRVTSKLKVEAMKTWVNRTYPDLVRLFQLTRYELNSAAADWKGRLSLRQRSRLRKLRNARGLKLNVACGQTSNAGWINVDVTAAADIRMDLRRPFPLRDGSASMLFCEHFCDHLNFPHEIARFLTECRRVLEPGGRARFVLHDAEDLLRAYLARDARYFELTQTSTPTMIGAVNQLFRFNDFHQFLYDFDTFEQLLREAGFSEVVRCRYRQSKCPELVLDHVHPSREIMSMYVEAVK